MEILGVIPNSLLNFGRRKARTKADVVARGIIPHKFFNLQYDTVKFSKGTTTVRMELLSIDAIMTIAKKSKRTSQVMDTRRQGIGQ